MSGRDTQAIAILSVTDAIDDFLEELERGSARDRHDRPFAPEAARELHWCLTGLVSPEFAALRLGEVGSRDVEELLHELADSGVGLPDRLAMADSLRALFDYAERRGLVDDNPAEWIAPSDDVEEPEPESTLFDRAISFGLRAATAGFLLIALILIAQSL